MKISGIQFLEYVFLPVWNISTIVTTSFEIEFLEKIFGIDIVSYEEMKTMIYVSLYFLVKYFNFVTYKLLTNIILLSYWTIVSGAYYRQNRNKVQENPGLRFPF